MSKKIFMEVVDPVNETNLTEEASAKIEEKVKISSEKEEEDEK